jgi:hypothetical protein
MKTSCHSYKQDTDTYYIKSLLLTATIASVLSEDSIG